MHVVVLRARRHDDPRLLRPPPLRRRHLRCDQEASSSGSASSPASTRATRSSSTIPTSPARTPTTRWSIMPIFCEGELIAWTASSSHTADTGGAAARRGHGDLPRGHPHPGREGRRAGRVPRGRRSRRSSSSAATRSTSGSTSSRASPPTTSAPARFLQLVEQLRHAFVEAAGAEASSTTPRRWPASKLRALPDGTWTLAHVRHDASTARRASVQSYRIVCTMTKRDDTLADRPRGHEPAGRTTT